MLEGCYELFLYFDVIAQNPFAFLVCHFAFSYCKFDVQTKKNA